MSICNCSGSCLWGNSCPAYPNGRENGCYSGYSTMTPPTFSEIQNFKNKVNIDVERIMQQVNAQEHTINHNQMGIDACLSWLEAIDPPIRKPDGKPKNPFEYIAVDAKRRDDMTYIKKTLYEFYCWIINTVEDNKERSKGIERLEEAAMWLNKSISRRKVNGTQDEK